MTNPNLERFKAAAAKAGKSGAVRTSPNKPSSPNKRVVVAKPVAATPTIRGRALIVDPQERVGRMLGNMLKSQHLEPSITVSGIEALTFLNMEQYCLIVIAQDPIDMTAYSLCSKIRTVKTAKEVPIILAQTAVNEAAKQGAMMVEANGVITRPYSLPELMEAIRAAAPNKENDSENGSPKS